VDWPLRIAGSGAGLVTISVEDALLVQFDPADILNLNDALDRLAQRDERICQHNATH
jgi:hypothetical protein